MALFYCALSLSREVKPKFQFPKLQPNFTKKNKKERKTLRQADRPLRKLLAVPSYPFSVEADMDVVPVMQSQQTQPNSD